MKLFKDKSKRLIGLTTVLIILICIAILNNIEKTNSNIYFEQSNIMNEKDLIGKHLKEGEIIKFAGTDSEGYSGDGDSPTNTKLNKPRGIYIDKSDNVYIADSVNHRIRMIPSESGTYYGVSMEKQNIYTIAGNGIIEEDGSSYYSGDNGKAIEAQLNYPQAITLDSDNNLYIADTFNNCVRKVNVDGIITTVAGIGQGQTTEINGDGKKAIEAKLGRITSLAVDSSDQLYIGENIIAHGENYIRKVDLNNGDISTVTSKNIDDYISYGDGRLLKDTSMSHEVEEIIFDTEDNMYISTNNIVAMIPIKDGIYFNIPMDKGKLYYVAGRYDISIYQGDGLTSTGTNLKHTHGIGVDSIGNLYINDNTSNQKYGDNTVYFIDRKSGLITSIAGNGSGESPGNNINAKNSKLGRINGISIDSNDNIYVCDNLNSKIYKIEPSEIDKNPPILNQDFNKSVKNQSVDFNFKDNDDWAESILKVYVNGEDIKNNYKVEEEKLTISKKIFNNGGIYIVRIKANGYNDNFMVKKINKKPKELKPDNRTNKVGNKIEITFEDDEEWRDGVLKHSLKYGVFINDKYAGRYELMEGKLIIDPTLVPKSGTYTIRVSSLGYDDSIIEQKILERERPTDAGVKLGKIKTLAGTGEVGYYGEGIRPTEAKIMPGGIYIDMLGNIFISDTSNQRIRMIPKESGINYGINMIKGNIYTVAGDGTRNEHLVKDLTKDRTTDFLYAYVGKYGGDGEHATKAQLNNPRNVVVDKNKNIYISDYANNCIRKVDSQGIISTVVGSRDAQILKNSGEGTYGDGGQATATPISNAFDMHINHETDTLYFSQLFSIRKVDLKTGIINTVTGSESDGLFYPGRTEAIGDGGSVEEAEFNAIKSITFDKDENLYIIDNNQIRMIPNESGTYFGMEMTSGNIYTISGHYFINDYFGDGYAASDGRLRRPNNIRLDSKGNLYIADTQNNCIRLINKKSGTIHTILGNEHEKFGHINAIEIDKDDNLYFVDKTNNKVYYTKIFHE